MRRILGHLIVGLLTVASGAALARADSDSLRLPLQESFAGPMLSGAWRPDLAPGANVAVRDGALEITAPANAFAHVRRALNIDNFRATFAVQPDFTTTWSPSLFLYWDPANWCSVSFRGGPFAPPIEYCAVMEDGVLTEAFGLLDQDQSPQRRYSVDSRGMVQKTPAECELAGHWRHLGIDLSADRIAFLVSPDGQAWTRFRWMPRRGQVLRQPPRQLIVGKGFSQPGSGYPAENLCNSNSDVGAPAQSRIASVAVTPLTAEILRATRDAEYEGRDTLGQAILSRPGDPTFDTVKGAFPAMRFGRELVGVKDHPNDFGIAPDGSIELGGGAFFFELADAATTDAPGSAARFGIDHGEPSAHKQLDHGYLPIVISDWRHDGLNCRQCVVGWSDGFSPDAPIFAYARLTVSNPGDEQRRVHIAGRFHSATAASRDSANPAAAWDLVLPPRSQQSLVVKIPFSIGAPEQPASAEFDTRLAEAEQYWTKLLNQGAALDVPDPRIANAYRAWLAYNFLNVDKEKGLYKPKDGSGFYEEVFGISATLYCRILDQYGYHDDAARYLESLLSFVQPDGSFIVNYGLPDIGAFLLALDEHYQTTGDQAWLQRMSPSILKMANWIVDRRQRDRVTQAPDAVYYGMIFERPYCDYPQKSYNFVSDLHLVAGLFAAANSLSAAGRAADAGRLQREAETYRADLLADMRRAAIEVDGLKVIPMFPQTHALLKAANYTAQDYYSLQSGQILEEGLIDPNGWEARSIVDFMEQRGGLVLGVCRFMGGIDHAYTYGYWFNCLQRGDARKVLLGLYSSLAFGMTRDTYSGVEVTFLRSGINMMTLPHLYSGTQQLRLLRAILLYEDGQDLVLCQAIPTAWLEDGKHVALSHAPSRFGTLSFRIDSHVNDHRVTIDLEPPTRVPPRTIRIRLRHPQGKPILSATAAGQPVPFKGDTLLLNSPSSPLTIDVRF